MSKGPAPRPALERLMEKVQPVPWSGCWLWLGAVNSNGYGHMLMQGRRFIDAHRMSYVLHKGTIPAGLTLDHLCRIPFCVNPDHLEAVSYSENCRRGLNPEITRARHAAKTHCKYGHPFSQENTRIEIVKGRVCRVCRVCNSNKQRKQRLRRKEQENIS